MSTEVADIWSTDHIDFPSVPLRGPGRVHAPVRSVGQACRFPNGGKVLLVSFIPMADADILISICLGREHQLTHMTHQ